MGQTIVVPSGDRLEFPDGMADADIEKAIFAEYPDLAPKKAPLGTQEQPMPAMPSAADMINEPWVSSHMPKEETINLPGSVMNGVAKSAIQQDAAAVDTLGVPVTREFQNRVRRQMDALSPEQRQAMAELPDMRGRVAKELLRQYQAIDASAASFDGVRSPTITELDTRKEKRALDLARQGLDPKYTAGVAEISAAAGADRNVDRIDASELDFEAQKPGLTRAWRDWESGVVGSTGATLAYTGRKAGVQALADIGDSMDKWARGKMPANPTFADELVSAFGSSGSFLIPGIGVARGTEALAILSQTAAKWAGAGTMAALEAAAESDGVYKDLVQRGASEQDAMAKADGVFWKNMALLGVTDKIGFFNDMKAARGALARARQQAAVAAPLEAIQEGGQQVISNEATDKPLMEGVPSSMAIGGIVGGGSGAVHGALAPQRAEAGDRLAQRLYENVEGAKFDPDQIDAQVRQSLSPDSAQLRRTGAIPASPTPAPSARAELQAILNDKRPVEEILAETQNQQAEAAGWPAINTPVVAKLPDGQVIAGQIQRIDNGAARFVARDGEVWVFHPGEAEIAAASGDGTRAAPIKAETADDVKLAEQAVNTSPTEAQKDAGNYRLGHLKLQGMDIAIETPAGATRAGVDRAGKPWSVTMNHTYGYIKGAEAKDGDKLDAFIGPNPQSQAVYVIDQIDPKTGNYDEAKVMLGFGSADEARAAYLSNYEQGWQGLGAITPMHVDAFKAWIAKGDTRKALAYDQKAATAKRNADTVRELALEEQRKAGWNSAWPFIPADLGNNDFRDLIRKDPAISAEEKEAIFAAGKALGVIPKGEKATKPAAPVQTADTLPRSPQPVPEAAGLQSIGDTNAQAPEAIQSPAALQNLSQAAPKAGALPGELTPGTQEYNAFFEKKAAADQEKRDADQREQRRAESQAAVDKKNSWREKLLAWFDGAKDGDTITTDMADDDYRVIEKTIDRNGKKIQSKRLVQVGGMGEGRDKTVIEHRDGQVYQGLNTNQTIDPSAGFAQAPETDADSIGAQLGKAMEDGRAKVGAGVTPIVAQQSDNPNPPSTGESPVAQPGGTTEKSVSRTKTGKLEASGFSRDDITESLKTAKIKATVAVGQDGKILVSMVGRDGNFMPMPAKQAKAIESALMGKTEKPKRARTFTGNLRNDVNLIAPGLYAEVARGGDGEGIAKFDMSLIAERLRDEGFMLPTTETGKDSDAVIELIRQDIANGGGTLNEARMVAAITAEEERRHKLEVRRLAEEYGIEVKNGAMNRPFDDIEQDVASAIAEEANRIAGYAGQIRDEAIKAGIPAADVDAIMDSYADQYDKDTAQDKFVLMYRDIINAIQERIDGHQGQQGRGSESESGSERDQAAPGQGAAAFELTGQTEADARAEEERLAAAEAQRLRDEQDAENKRKADAARDDFRLTGSTRQADIGAAYGQGGLFDAPSAPSDGYADTPRIRQLRQKASEIESGLPAVADGMTRLWRGNRPGEVGKNPQFTNSLIGIALPFSEAYGGPVSYVDVTTADLPKYENTGTAASGAEFILPAEVASKAKAVGVDSTGRFEVGRSLTKEQKKAVLKTLVDVYKANDAPREFKGQDKNGNERYGYAHSPEFFVKSDITGAMVRYHVTLPDGRIAHPTELFPEYSQADIDAELERQKTEAKNKKLDDEFRLKTLNSRKSANLNEANRLFWKQNPTLAAQSLEYVPALLTNGNEFIRTDPAYVDRDLELLGDGWSEKKSGAEAAEPVKSGDDAVKPFDSEAWDKERADRIKQSKEAGQIHLDQVTPSVETMRGKTIFYVHDRRQKGVIRTVDNRGNVYVYWADKYSADKELASETVEDNKAWLKDSKNLPYMREVRDGKTYVFSSSLGPSDLKDYHFAGSQDTTATPKQLEMKARAEAKVTPKQKEMKARAEAKSAPAAVSTAEAGKANEVETATEDAGEELKYNKRNRIVRLKWDDIKDQDAALKVKQVVKAKVLEKPDYQAMIDGGTQPLIAHIVKQVYDGLSAKPQTRTAPSDEQLELYIDGMNRVMNGAMAWAESQDSVEWLKKMGESASVQRAAMTGSRVDLSSMAGKKTEFKRLLDYIYPEGWKEYRPELMIVGGNRAISAMQPGLDETIKALKEIEKGWPGTREAWQVQGYSIKQIVPQLIVTTYYEDKRRDGTPYVSVRMTVADGRQSLVLYSDAIHGAENKTDSAVQDVVNEVKDGVTGKHVLFDKGNRMVGAYDSLEAAQEAAREKVKRTGGGGIKEEGISVQAARRVGKARREDGENITSAKLMETFGFRGVNFGNWMKGKANEAERQLHLNHAYDAFLDLAEILDVPPKAMSLNGMLGLAIGAQGNGKAAAHFVPGLNEINITRTAGAGAVAHEWGHALDHYFARKAGLERESEPFLTEHANSPATMHRIEIVDGARKSVSIPRFGEGLRPEILDRFREVVGAMNKRELTREEVAERKKNHLDSAIRNVSKWLDSIRLDYMAPHLQGKIQGSDFDAIANRIKAMDLGSGEKVRLSKWNYISPVVAELRDLYKTKTGRSYNPDNIKALQSWVDSVEYGTKSQQEDEAHKPQTTTTTYAANAAKLDHDKGGKKYWSTDLEKFARAFDAFVSDQLAERAARNTYLAGLNNDIETSPMGEERKATNAAFKALVDTIETKETETGVALESRAAASSQQSASTRAIQSVVEGFRKQFAGAAALNIRVVRTVADIPARFRPSPFAEGVFHDDAGLIYLVASNLRNDSGDVNAGRAWQVLMHESVGHFGLAHMMGERFNRILPRVKNAAKAKAPVKEDIYQPGHQDYATFEAVKLRYPEATETEVAQEVLARMAETDPGKPIFGYIRAMVRQWFRDMARAAGFDIDITDTELNDLVALASRYMRRGDNLGTEDVPRGTVAASKKVGAGKTAVKSEPVRIGDVYAHPSGRAITVERVLPGGNAEVAIHGGPRKLLQGTWKTDDLKELEKIGRADFMNDVYTTPESLIDLAKQRANPGILEDLSTDRQSAIRRAIDRANALELGRDVAPLKQQRVRNRLGKLREELESGKIDEPDFVAEVEKLHAQMELAFQAKQLAPIQPRARGADWIRQKLLEAKRRGDISDRAADLAEWFILQNPALVDDLGISIRERKEGQASGTYAPMTRIYTLFKGEASDETAVHEILHHLERMMPADMQDEIRREWMKQATKELAKAQKAGDKRRVDYFMAALAGDQKAATKILTNGKMDVGRDYRYMNASEFWAVNMTETVADRFTARDSVWARSLQWLREALEHIKAVLGLNSRHPLIKALNNIGRGDGEFVSRDMLGSSETYANIAPINPVIEEVVGPVLRDISLPGRLLLHPRQVAANHKEFAPVFDTAIRQYEERDSIVSKLGDLAKGYFDLSNPKKVRVGQVIEQGRLDRMTYTREDLENGIHHHGGDLVRLDDEEISAYFSLRNSFDEALTLFRNTMLEEYGFPELVNEERAALRLAQMIAGGEIEDKRLEWAKKVAVAVNEIEQAKRTGYIPFTRYGQFVVAVKALPRGVEVTEEDDLVLVSGIPESADEGTPEARLVEIVADLMGQYDDARGAWIVPVSRNQAVRALEKTLYATKVEVGGIKEWRSRGKDVTEIPEVKAAFDAAKAEYGGVPNARIIAFHIAEKEKAREANVTAMDELAKIASVDTETWDEVRAKLQDAIKSRGFRRHFFGSDNTPGYSTDFERSIADYIIGMSGYLARRKHVKEFDDAITRIKAPKLAAYADEYRKYVNSPADEFALVKQIGFLSYIAGTVATAVTNLTQVPMLTVPTLAQFVPQHIAVRETARAWKDALAMFSPTDTGLQMFDPAKVPEDVREAFMAAWNDQLFVPLETLDLMATASVKTVGGRTTMRVMNQTTQAIAYLFMFAERINRMSTFIAAQRISRMPVAKQNMQRVIAGDAWAKFSIGGRKWNERSFAEWVVDESQYRMGKVNRPKISRGVGSPLLQFKGYMMQTIEAGYRMAAMHGPRGKVSFLAALAMMLMLGGLWGLPGLEDLRDIIEKFYKLTTGKDLDLKTETRRIVAETTGSASAGAAVSKGITYATIGVDMSRVGMGNMIPDSPLQVFGIPADLGIGRPMRAAERTAAGNYYGAMTELLPNFLKNPAVGLQWKFDGLRDRYGSRLMTPGEFDYGDVAVKSLGWTPTKVTNRRDYTYAESRAESGINELKRRYTNDLVRAYVREKAATTDAERKQYKDELEAIIKAIDKYNEHVSDEDKIVPHAETMAKKAGAEMVGGKAREGKERKLSRDAAQQRRELFQVQ